MVCLEIPTKVSGPYLPWVKQAKRRQWLIPFGLPSSDGVPRHPIPMGTSVILIKGGQIDHHSIHPVPRRPIWITLRRCSPARTSLYHARAKRHDSPVIVASNLYRFMIQPTMVAFVADYVSCRIQSAIRCHRVLHSINGTFSVSISPRSTA